MAGAQVESALEELFNDEAAYRRMSAARNPYGDGHAAPRIASVLRNEDLDQWRLRPPAA